ncbi:hypothetical protein LCGC14_2949040, partial [marine sediment metagenome]
SCKKFEGEDGVGNRYAGKRGFDSPPAPKKPQKGCVCICHQIGTSVDMCTACYKNHECSSHTGQNPLAHEPSTTNVKNQTRQDERFTRRRDKCIPKQEGSTLGSAEKNHSPPETNPEKEVTKGGKPDVSSEPAKDSFEASGSNSPSSNEIKAKGVKPLQKDKPDKDDTGAFKHGDSESGSDFNLSKKRKELFGFHIRNPANCNNGCVKSLKDSVEQQDKEFIRRLEAYENESSVGKVIVIMTSDLHKLVGEELSK